MRDGLVWKTLDWVRTAYPATARFSQWFVEGSPPMTATCGSDWAKGHKAGRLDGGLAAI